MLNTTTLKFNTGKIFISDWFRSDEAEFEKYTEQFIPRFKNDINTDAGTIQETKDYAEKMNIGFVFVGNNSPRILKIGNDLIFGHLKYNDIDSDEDIVISYQGEDYQYSKVKVGSICTDLWWTTIADDELLNKIFNIDTSNNEEFGADNQIDIKPGTYELNFSEHYSCFNNDSVQKFQITGFEPYFILNYINN